MRVYVHWCTDPWQVGRQQVLAAVPKLSFWNSDKKSWGQAEPQQPLQEVCGNYICSGWNRIWNDMKEEQETSLNAHKMLQTWLTSRKWEIKCTKVYLHETHTHYLPYFLLLTHFSHTNEHKHTHRTVDTSAVAVFLVEMPRNCPGFVTAEVWGNVCDFCKSRASGHIRPCHMALANAPPTLPCLQRIVQDQIFSPSVSFTPFSLTY